MDYILHLYFILLYVLACEFRAGGFETVIPIHKNFFLRIISTIIVSFASFFFLEKYDIWLALGNGVAFFLFFLQGWGPWFDLGTKEPEPGRGSFPLKQISNFLEDKVSDVQRDGIVMFVRGLSSVMIFGFVGLYMDGYKALIFQIPSSTILFALYFVLVYYGAHNTKRISRPDSYIGFMISLFIIGAVI